VATDGGVGASQVAWFPGFVQGAEGSRNVFGELRAGGGVDGIGAREAFEIPELSERADNFLWVGQDGDWVGEQDENNVSIRDVALTSGVDWRIRP
jgi:hypothetical protein